MAAGENERERLLAVQEKLRAGDLAAAAGLAEEALREGIEHPLPLGALAARREQQGRFEEALDYLRRAKAAVPATAALSNAIGLSLTRLGRYDEALAEYGEALAIDPRFAKALANRGMALIALSRLNQARRDLEAAAAIEPGNPIAANGLAGLALRRGEAAEARRLALQVLAHRPGFPSAVLTAAGADLAEGKAAAAEAPLRALGGDARIDPSDRASAYGLLGDALDAQRRFAEAFQAWSDANALLKEHYRARFGAQPGSAALLRQLSAALAGKRIAAAPGAGGAGPAKRHVFLLGFPRSGTTLVEQVLEQHPEITTLAERECLAGASRDWLADSARFEAFCAAPDSALEPYRAAYWRRVRAEGADPAGRVFVDKHPFHTFRLPLIARLFPEARILFARRDPRDVVLSCFRHRFQMAAPVYEMLTLEGAAALYAAAMELAAASEAAFGLAMHAIALEALIADFDGETRKACDFIGVAWTPALRDFAAEVGGRGIVTPSAPQLARGLNARGVGKWRDYADQMAPVLPLLAPWAARFGVR